MTAHLVNRFLAGQRLVILGFGQEGRSTYRFIRKHLPHHPVVICDQDAALGSGQADTGTDPNILWHTGSHYLEGLKGADTIIKSPGVPFRLLGQEFRHSLITSQTELFIRFFRDQITGITGTKGKSTTSALLHHILCQSGKQSLLLGNIGLPPFDMIDQIKPGTLVVYEMSSHQLEHIRVSPHQAVMLNIFEEHLDHYPSYDHYQQAKMNIARWQTANDILLYHADNKILGPLVANAGLRSRLIRLTDLPIQEEHLRYEGDDLVISTGDVPKVLQGLGANSRLPGRHNRVNIAAASFMAMMSGVAPQQINRAVSCFRGLPHRLEFIGTAKGIRFYNDSISTIPESTIAAVEAFPGTTTLILGGYDRGVDYQPLIGYLGRSGVRHIIFTGEAGLRMMEMTEGQEGYAEKRCTRAETLEEAFDMATRAFSGKGVCLLSPAAASYDAFRNFKERGDRFRTLVNAWITNRK